MKYISNTPIKILIRFAIKSRMYLTLVIHDVFQTVCAIHDKLTTKKKNPLYSLMLQSSYIYKMENTPQNEN